MFAFFYSYIAFIKSYMEHEPADQDANEWRVWEIGKEIANRMVIIKCETIFLTYVY